MEHIVIKIILLCGLFGITLLWLKILGGRLAGRLFFIGQFLAGTALVCFPQLAQACADFVGVGRGTDLILYLLVLVVYASGLVTVIKFHEQERKLTELARQITLLQAEKKHLPVSPASETEKP